MTRILNIEFQSLGTLVTKILGINSHSPRNSFTPFLLAGTCLKRRSGQEREVETEIESDGGQVEMGRGEREWWRDLAGFRRSIRCRASGNCLVCYCHYHSSHLSLSPQVSLANWANLNLSCLSERAVGFCAIGVVCACASACTFSICLEMKLILQTRLCLHLPSV